MTSYKNNAPTMTPDEIAFWEQRVEEGRLVTDLSSNNLTHGTNSTYTAGCRCESCTEAQREYHRARRAANPEKYREYQRQWRARQKAEVAK